MQLVKPKICWRGLNHQPKLTVYMYICTHETKLAYVNRQNQT